MDEREFKELVLIRKELQNIRAILQYRFAPTHERVHETDESGKQIIVRRTLEDPLEKIRRECSIDQ